MSAKESRMDLENPNPVEVDTRLAELGQALSKLYSDRHHLLSTAEARKARGLEPEWTDAATREYLATGQAIDSIRQEMKPLEECYGRHGWPRWFPCMNAGGHLHETLSCDSLYASTRMAWRTDLSGRDAASVVAEFGTDVCSVCVPSAPTLPQPAYGSVSYQLRELGRAQRAARSAELKAKREANTLVAPVLDSHGWKVRTVTEARHALKSAMPYALGIASTANLREGLKADSEAGFARVREALVLKLGEEAVADIVAKMEKNVRREWRRHGR